MLVLKQWLFHLAFSLWLPPQKVTLILTWPWDRAALSSVVSNSTWFSYWSVFKTVSSFDLRNAIRLSCALKVSLLLNVLASRLIPLLLFLLLHTVLFLSFLTSRSCKPSHIITVRRAGQDIDIFVNCNWVDNR
jgi:hypothetical protein